MSINESKFGQVGVSNAMIASGPVIIQERNGRLETLLVKHGDKPLTDLKWKFPGGKVEKGETLEQTAIRESKQEIGADVTLVRPLIPMILWNEVPEGGSEKPQAIVLIHYLATIAQGPFRGKGVLAMEWFPIDALPPDCATNVRPVIESYLANP